MADQPLNGVGLTLQEDCRLEKRESDYSSDLTTVAIQVWLPAIRTAGCVFIR